VEQLEVKEEICEDEVKALGVLGIYLEKGSKPFNYHPTAEEEVLLKKEADDKAKQVLRRQNERTN
jgi:hypothetical protein